MRSHHKSGFVASRISMSSTAWRFLSALSWEVFLLRACRRYSAIVCSVSLSFRVAADLFSTCYYHALFARSERRTMFPSTTFFSALSVSAHWSAVFATDRQRAKREAQMGSRPWLLALCTLLSRSLNGVY